MSCAISLCPPFKTGERMSQCKCPQNLFLARIRNTVRPVRQSVGACDKYFLVGLLGQGHVIGRSTGNCSVDHCNQQRSHWGYGVVVVVLWLILHALVVTPQFRAVFADQTVIKINGHHGREDRELGIPLLDGHIQDGIRAKKLGQ